MSWWEFRGFGEFCKGLSLFMASILYSSVSLYLISDTVAASAVINLRKLMKTIGKYSILALSALAIFLFKSRKQGSFPVWNNRYSVL